MWKKLSTDCVHNYYASSVVNCNCMRYSDSVNLDNNAYVQEQNRQISKAGYT